MKIKEYLIHSVKYLIRIAVLVTLIYGLFFIADTATVSAEQHIRMLFTTTKGLTLLGVLVILAIAYPLFGFIKRSVNVDFDRDREEIIRIFHAANYHNVDSGLNNEMTFRSSSLFRRISLLFDDKLTVIPEQDGKITISGIRKEVVQIQFRIETYIRNKDSEDEK